LLELSSAGTVAYQKNTINGKTYSTIRRNASFLSRVGIPRIGGIPRRGKIPRRGGIPRQGRIPRWEKIPRKGGIKKWE
jgi:hypothetical protein